MRDVVETEHNIRIALRREVVWEERIPVVDDENQRSLHLVGAEQGADGFVFFVLVVGFAHRVLTSLGVDTLGFPATDGTLYSSRYTSLDNKEKCTDPWDMMRRPSRANKSRLDSLSG